MYTTDMNEFKVKQDEMLRQAEKYRLIQAVQKAPTPAARAIQTLRTAISYLFSL